MMYRRAQYQHMRFRGVCGFPYEGIESDEAREELNAINRLYQSLLNEMDADEWVIFAKMILEGFLILHFRFPLIFLLFSLLSFVL